MTSASIHQHRPERALKLARGPGWRRSLPVRRTAATIAASLGLAVLAAGCGGSNAPGVPGAGSHNNNHTRASSSHGAIAQLLAYARCMRSHGISDFPDPTTTGGGISISQHGGPGSDLNPQSLAYRSAQQSCGHLLPAGGHGSAQPTAHDTAQMLHVSQCMRQHGIAGFPDPTQSSPGNPSEYSAVISRNGVVFAIPKSIDVNSPAFKQAGTACNFGPPT